MVLYFCVWGIVEVPVLSQESEWSCISVFVEVPVSQESEWSCISVFGVLLKCLY